MPDSTDEQVEPQEPATGTEQVNGEAQDESLGESGKKALTSEREARKEAERELRAAQSRLKEIEDAQLSDLEKAQNEAKEWRSKAEAATAETLRYRIAAKYSISEEDAQTFLTGTDEETLTRQAERLHALARPSGSPAPDPSQGARGTPTKTTPAQQFADAFAGRI
ncbi:MAG TPA: hypothetical protein VK053_16790 [Jiangellaceae bacterium]|nr:hypothetical protein [Jiangellaceae bacterium]